MLRVVSIIRILLLTIMTVVIMSATASAITSKDGAWDYYLEGTNDAVINRCHLSDENVVIPSEVDGHPVRRLEGKAENGYIYAAFLENLESVSIPASVREIGMDTFYRCSQLEKVTISEGVTTIVNCAFDDCVSLSTITIPKSVDTIEYGAFRGTKLWKRQKGIVYAGNWAIGFKGKSPSTIKIRKGTVGIAGLAFKDRKMKKVVLPSSLKHINEFAFDGCKKLSKVNIPKKVKKIGDGAFSDCYSLKKIVLSKNVTEVGDAAFADCKKLSKIIIRNPRIGVGNASFQSCAYDKKKRKKTKQLCFGKILYDAGPEDGPHLSVKQGVRNITRGAINGNPPLKSISIPRSVKIIEAGALNNCFNVTKIKVDKRNKVYDSRGNCNAVIHKKTKTLVAGCKATKIPGSVRHIGKNAFNLCQEMTKITIPGGVKTIGESAFEANPVLKKVTIKKGVKRIDAFAFLCCPKLKKITIPSSVTYIGRYAFGYNAWGIHPKRVKGFTIYGKKGSVAAQYAKANKLKFVAKDV